MTGGVLDALAALGVGDAEPLRAADHRGAARSTTSRSATVGRFLFERGIYVTLAAYPLVPKDEVGFRIQVTAANTDEQIAQADRRAGRARRSASSCSRPRRRRDSRAETPEGRVA